MKQNRLFFCALLTTLCVCASASEPFNGLDLTLGNLARVSKAKTRSISPENFNGEKGKAGMSTNGPKVRSLK